MICHVCRQEAVGQCKSCGKFYCPEHGDTYCATCKEARESPSPEGMPQVQDRPAEPGGLAGPTCFLCPQPAAGACGKCGRFFCAAHRGEPGVATELWGTKGRMLCAECMRGANAYNTFGCVVVAAAVLIGGIVIMIGLSQMR